MQQARVVFNLPLSREFTYEIPDDICVKPGVRVKAPFGSRLLMGYVVAVEEQGNDHEADQSYTLKKLHAVVDPEPVFGELHLQLARWMSRMYFSNIGECLGIMVPSGKREKEPPGGEEEAFSPKPLELSEEQQMAVREILTQDQGAYYLYGMTGSGKTEVFLRAAAQTLEEGRGVVYLVPEIALTAQVVQLIRTRFGSSSAVLHSRLTPSQRLAEWRRIVRGDARIVVGARSAVFAPVPRLGLIILDEEHEGSYKSQNKPRYHARQIAMRRCSTEKARLVMGSATPSVEAFALMDQGGLKRLNLTRRLAGGQLPSISIVNMSKQEGPLSRELVEEMTRTKDMGKQSLLFLNRRGFSYFFQCRSCGQDAKCRHCSASLTYHKSQGMMICHYCGYKTAPVTTCPTCGSLDVSYSGFGTEHVEEAVRTRFPDWRIERLDGDSAQIKGHMEATIQEFRDGKIDVLLGTQMIAKGLNFPGVRLVGLVMADSGLHMPDFRSAERTFSLITQVSGRAGRYTPDGLVIIQTFNPHSLPIALSSVGDIEGFYRKELEVRRFLKFPPFGRIIRLVVRSKKKNSALALIQEIAKRVHYGQNTSSHGQEGEVEILGPAEAPLSLLAGNHRFHLLVIGKDFSHIHGLVHHSLKNLQVPSAVYLEIDVDPVSLM